MEDKLYRRGAVGALLDIYEEAILKLKNLVETIPDNRLAEIIDPQTPDTNCRSVQSILSHVVHGGFGYATSINNLKGDIIQRPDKTYHSTIKEYLQELSDVFTYTENIFKKLNDDDLEQLDNSLKIKTGWGQWYDIEQLTEHAIVHILRHKRQIERLLAQRQ
ncbi:MAG: DinB family protein [Ferruginibacter sp.]